jgi:hypothetical protein
VGMDHCVRTYQRLTGQPLHEVIRMASLTPIAHESASAICFPKFASTMIRAHSPAREICGVAAPSVLETWNQLLAQLNAYS